jgi:hypothetical protein
MAEATFPFTAYDVSLDRDSLKTWDLDRDGMGYAVALAGSLDDRWARCYHLIRIGSPSYIRFHLDSEKKIVWFACRAKDAASKIQPVLDKLEELVQSVNAAAEAQAWDEWGERR